MIFMKTLDEKLIIDISKQKDEPKWMLDFRLKSFSAFKKLDNPNFGPKLDIDFNSINYYKKVGNNETEWKNVSCDIRNKFKSLGVIDADLFKEYFNNLVKYDENKYTALNGALWSGGSFIYIPKNTKLDRPLQSYFRIDSIALGQFERTIIIVDEGSELSYIEGCTAESHSANSLHAGVVEIYVKKNAKCKYSTIQNWSGDVYNLVTKRAIVGASGLMEWVDGNIGSKVTMKYPSCILLGDYAVGNSISIAYAKSGQILDAGAKMIHIGAHTKSNIVSKSIAADGGTANYRGTTKICESAINSEARIKCDTIMLDDNSISDTIPFNVVYNDSSILEHEATVSKISEDKLQYLMSKGIDETHANINYLCIFFGRFYLFV